MTHCLGHPTYAKGVRDDGRVKTMSCHTAGILLGCGACPGTSPCQALWQWQNPASFGNGLIGWLVVMKG